MQLKWYEVRSYVRRLPVGPKLDWDHSMPRVERRTLMCSSHCTVYYIKKATVKLFMFTSWTRMGEVKVELQSFLISTLFVAEWSTSCLGRFIPAFNPLNDELNSICHLLALLGVHHFLHVSKIMVKSLTLRLLMSYIYGAPILDVCRSHTKTHHSR